MSKKFSDDDYLKVLEILWTNDGLFSDKSDSKAAAVYTGIKKVLSDKRVSPQFNKTKFSKSLIRSIVSTNTLK